MDYHATTEDGRELGSLTWFSPIEEREQRDGGIFAYWDGFDPDAQRQIEGLIQQYDSIDLTIAGYSDGTMPPLFVRRKENADFWFYRFRRFYRFRKALRADRRQRPGVPRDRVG